MQTRASITATRSPPRAAPLAATVITLSMLAACMGSEAPRDESNEEPVATRAEALTPSADGVTSASADGVSPAAQQASTAETPVARVCLNLLQRERDCSAVFLPALVAERVRPDIPAGITAEDHELGRDALLTHALNEYTDDSTDERIASTCAGLAQRLPADRGERLVTSGEACLAHDTCEPFAACAVPISVQP